MIGFTWDMRPDLKAKWPNATDPEHSDRSALLQWALDGGMKEIGLMPDGGLPPQSQRQPMYLPRRFWKHLYWPDQRDCQTAPSEHDWCNG